MDNIKGSTAAFATFSPFKSHLSRYLEWIALGFAPVNDEAARQPKFLHTAHFLPISPSQLRRAGLFSENLKFGALLFISAYNGDPETYFRGFNTKLFSVMNEVWKHCNEWQGAEEFRNLNAFIAKFCRRSDTFFNAYPDQSKRIRASLVLRRQIDKLLPLALADRPDADDEFKRAFDRMVQIHWGTEPLTKDDQ